MIRSAEPSPTRILGHVDQGILVVIQELFRAAGRQVRTRLVNRCGRDVPVRFGGADLISLGSIQDRIENEEGAAFIAFRVDPGDMPGMLIIEGPLLYRLVGMLLGEGGQVESPLYRFRSLTKVDLRIAGRIAEDALEGLVDALSGASETSIRIEKVSSSPRWSFPLPRSTTILEGTLDLGPPTDPYGLLSFVLPAAIARQLIPGISARVRETEHVGMERVSQLPVEVTAELTSISMPLSELEQLRPGSMIDLGNVGRVTVRAGEHALFSAEAGEQAGARSVRITKRRQGGDS